VLIAPDRRQVSARPRRAQAGR